MLGKEEALRLTLMYTTANLVLVVLAGALRHEGLKGFVACNSLLILAVVYVVQVMFPKDYERTYRSFAFDVHGAIVLDFAVHTLPVLIALRWLPLSGAWQVALPALALLTYLSVADFKWIYKVQELELCRVAMYALALYVVGLAACKMGDRQAVIAMLVLAVGVSAVLFARVGIPSQLKHC